MYEVRMMKYALTMPKQKPKPKPRHTWAINPKTRIVKSKKTYSRTEEKKKVHGIVKQIHWFGEQ